MYSIGQEIKTLRKQLHLTQSQLCENICTQATISLIEKDEIKPRLEILYLISIKLNKPISHFANILLDGDYSYKLAIETEIESLTTEQNFSLVYQIVQRELSFNTELNWYTIFLKWNYAFSSYALSLISIDDCIIELKSLINNHKDFILRKDYLADRIYNSIAFLYSTKNDFETAIFYYNKINIEKHFANENLSPRINTPIYYIRVLYNKAKTAYDMKDYHSSSTLIDRGIELSIQYENMSFLGNFYYYKGLISEQINESTELISASYNKALHFFEILNRTAYLAIIKKEKSKYLNSCLEKKLT